MYLPEITDKLLLFLSQKSSGGMQPEPVRPITEIRSGREKKEKNNILFLSPSILLFFHSSSK